MSADDLLAIVARLSSADIAVWLDGGWGVDALLGEQTRAHDDLDLVIAASDLDAARSTLGAAGLVVAEDQLPTRLVLRDPADRRIDLHPVTFDDDGGGWQVLPDAPPFRYPPEGFSGRGQIDGNSVRCLTPEVQLLCHFGYEPDANDRHDMRLLAERFGLTLPPPYGKDGA